ncbi:hypothetical protein FQN52_001759 [Onygenales sp. PD_12]|nr:hypothetical protein FQN52_001759 [Onygenales sp. PD_12]
MFRLSITTASLLALLSLVLPQPAHGKDVPFPPIDLGYAVHVPTYVNSTASGLKFADYKNIRFAKPPLGDLRFRKPEIPPPKQEGVQNGSAAPFFRDCVSSVPPELAVPGLNGTTWGQEDCLFLNVRVPEGVKEGDNVPVLHWIFGGGYTYGSKDTGYDAVGVYDDMECPDQKFIYVASNYRLGTFGWTSSESEDMDANVGLHDARAALEWTNAHISKFGGDPGKVTAMGQSSGGGIIDFLLAGKEKLTFQQAFLSSPGAFPRRNPARRQYVFDEMLKATGCGDVACLRSSTEKELIDANKYLINNLTSEKGEGAMGPGIGPYPIVDGDSIPDLLSVRFADQKHRKDTVVSVLTGNMVNEGFGTLNPSDFLEGVREVIPNANQSTIDRIESLYTSNQRTSDWETDVMYACNAYHPAKAYDDRAKRYIMSVPPAVHAQDLNYYFFVNETVTPVEDVKLAREFQELLRRFVTGAKHTEKFLDLPDWPTYGSEEKLVLDFTSDGIVTRSDPWEEHGRCQILHEIISDPNNGA